jgi:hypothetical protein
MHEQTGARRWKYATGFPVTRSPAAVQDRVFVTSDEPALHCIDAATGFARWETPNITQFAALSRERVYGVNELGELVAIDAKTGAVIGRMATGMATNALVNDQTDRIYLISDDGLVQCLHELGADKPLEHEPKPTEDEQPPQTSDAEAEIPAETTDTTPVEPDVDEPSPFDDDQPTEDVPPEDAPAEDAEMPAEDDPFEADEENPFDF